MATMKDRMAKFSNKTCKGRSTPCMHLVNSPPDPIAPPDPQCGKRLQALQHAGSARSVSSLDWKLCVHLGVDHWSRAEVLLAETELCGRQQAGLRADCRVPARTAAWAATASGQHFRWQCIGHKSTRLQDLIANLWSQWCRITSRPPLDSVQVRSKGDRISPLQSETKVRMLTGGAKQLPGQRPVLDLFFQQWLLIIA